MTLIFISTCCEKSTSPGDDTDYIGWVVGNPDGGYACIFKTTNSGQTWVRQGDSLTVPNVPLNAVRAVDSLTAWAVGESAEGSFLKERGMIELSAPADSCVWVVGHGRTIIKTEDYGSSWSIQDAEIDPAWDANGVTAISEKVAWVAEDTGVIKKTVDGGVIWKQQNNVPVGTSGYYLYRISPMSEKVAWIVGPSYYDGIILYTVDGGESWTKQTYSPAVLLGDVSFVGSYH